MLQQQARLIALPILLSLMFVVAASDRIALAAGGGAGPVAMEAGDVLDRVAYAVDAAESSHGVDPRMWRSEPGGPQGPMQVSAAAAADVGGGDRFDTTENRALGRAYLAHMYLRYGSWPDALAAYNWGPGRVDIWINGGRPLDKFPAAVARYQARVLVASGLRVAATGDDVFEAINGRLARLRMLRLEAKRDMLERRRHGGHPDGVELLYAEIMRVTDPANPSN